MIRAKVYVTLKKGVLDPQGETVRGALETLGFAGVKDVRVGKFMVVTLNEVSREEASRRVDQMCKKLLANPVIEDYRFELEEG
ncbi:MAG: phosphoribosylformylglycinamidine synthase subunit PurS [candidate division NC10 bacterium CSP1-5]|nr:MAG: phosphoribosylformylglycinamidine synthase subunit PurS [candidate division NC10 bacterium CSP1-5]